MANRHRGEIATELGGRTRTLVLTLGALAEIEDAFGGNDILAIAHRLQSGRISARDCRTILAAGLRGAGEDVTDEDVARMTVAGGATGYVRIVADLLAATFPPPDDPPASTPRPVGEGLPGKFAPPPASPGGA